MTTATYVDTRPWSRFANGGGTPAYRRFGIHPLYGSGTWSIAMFSSSKCFGVAFLPDETLAGRHFYVGPNGSTEPFAYADDAARFTFECEAGRAEWSE